MLLFRNKYVEYLCFNNMCSLSLKLDHLIPDVNKLNKSILVYWLYSNALLMSIEFLIN
jgi:hypothetical protein